MDGELKSLKIRHEELESENKRIKERLIQTEDQLKIFKSKSEEAEAKVHTTNYHIKKICLIGNFDEKIA